MTMAARDYEAIRKQIRSIVEDVVRPNAERIDAEGLFPRDNLSALARAGWNGVLLPKALGGLGLDHVAFAIAAEEIGRACASTALVYVMHVGAAQTIALYGNDDQKRRWLLPARDGLIGTYSTSEKASGGHWWFNFSEAARDGSDYLVTAEKSFTTSSGQADYYVVQTRTPGAKGPTDITFFIVDGKAPGIRAGKWDGLGVRGNHSGPIRSVGVKVPARDRLGKEGEG
jgi:alkylation response protein AidB-like acyl-CoA dehydrogenase